jgi:membrane-associated protein
MTTTVQPNVAMRATTTRAVSQGRCEMTHRGARVSSSGLLGRTTKSMTVTPTTMRRGRVTMRETVVRATMMSTSVVCGEGRNDDETTMTNDDDDDDATPRVDRSADASTEGRKTTRAAVGRALALGAVCASAMALTAVLMPENAMAAAKSAAAVSADGANASLVTKALSWVMHLDKHLAELFLAQGKFAYGILFAIIFAETGFVVTPFLPGDSLLFATGALGALGVVNFPLTVGLLFAAAVLGDTVNYSIGSFVGKSFMETHPKIFPPEYIEKTKKFYEQYGGKTVVLARFFVIVRTFAPFVAGVANMDYSKFIAYNVIGAGVWIASFMGIGYFFGAIPAVQENFALAVAGIVVLSLVPIIVEIIQHARGKDGETAAASAP